MAKRTFKTATATQLPKEKASELLANFHAKKEAFKNAEKDLKEFLDTYSDKVFDETQIARFPGIGTIKIVNKTELKMKTAMPVQDIVVLLQEECILSQYVRKEISASTFPSLFKSKDLVDAMSQDKEIYNEAIEYGFFVESKSSYSFE